MPSIPGSRVDFIISGAGLIIAVGTVLEILRRVDVGAPEATTTASSSKGSSPRGGARPPPLFFSRPRPMKIFIFDTETTGFPQRNEGLEKQPHIVQVAGVLWDIDGATGAVTELGRINEMVKPPVSIPFGASQVHGIYDRDVADKPPFSAVVDTFLKMANGADAVAGHNVSFDEEIVSYELKRLGMDGWWHPRQVICTMRSSTEY